MPGDSEILARRRFTGSAFLVYYGCNRSFLCHNITSFLHISGSSYQTIRHIVLNQLIIITADCLRGIVEGGQEILPDIPDFSRIFIQTGD